MPTPTPTPPLRAPLRRFVPIQPRLPVSSDADSIADRAALQEKARAALAAKDAQRRRHRLAVQRSYHVKLEDLYALRNQERMLEKQYQQLLQQQSSQGAADHEPGNSPKAMYIKLADMRQALERKNTALRKVAIEYEQFVTRTRRLADVKDEAVRRDLPVTRQPPRQTATLASSTVKIKPLTMDDCLQVIHATWPQVLAFRRSRKNLRSSPTVFGWTHKSCVAPADAHAENASHILEYSISKVFPNLRASELSQRGWEIMTTQRHYQALHSSTMTSHMQRVQRVDNDSMVFLRTLKRAGQSTEFKTLLLASQFQVDKGVLTIFRNLDPARVVIDEDEDEDSIKLPFSTVVWLDMFAWTYCEDQSDGAAVNFEFGGEMRHTSDDNARFWMMEVLLMALRWENLAVGPLFKLTNA